MASELKLSGSAAGRIIVQGNDTITTDQTFTFPDTGGELATAPAGGSAVGYQQGTWTATASAGTVNGAKLFWYRIGNAVHINGDVADFSDTSSEIATIEGLPYTNSQEQSYGMCTGNRAYAGGGNNPLTMCYSPKNTTRIQFYGGSKDTSTGGTTAKYGDLQAGAVIHFSVTYLTDDTTWTPINGATVS